MSIRRANSVNLDNSFVHSLNACMVSVSLPFVWKECKDNRCRFSTNISATRDSLFAMYTYNRYLTRNLEMPIYPLTSPNLQLCGSNVSVSSGAILPYLFHQSFCTYFHLQLNTQSLQKSVLVSVIGNFLVNSKCLYLLWKFLINQQWWDEVFQSREN